MINKAFVPWIFITAGTEVLLFPVGDLASEEEKGSGIRKGKARNTAGMRRKNTVDSENRSVP